MLSTVCHKRSTEFCYIPSRERTGAVTMEGIDNNYISEAIDDVVGSLGIRESIRTEKIRGLLSAGKVKESIETMANCLGLPIRVSLQYVPAVYRPAGPGGQNPDDGFHSSALSRTDSHGRGIEGITAQVSIPGRLPFYGTPELSGFGIAVRVSDNCQGHPETFMAIMAHELCHVLLHSLWHKGKNNEVYTDLAAMVLGFSGVMESGRKHVETTDYGAYSQTSTTTYGYLPDAQFRFALNRVAKILQDRRTRWDDLMRRTNRRLNAYGKQVELHRRMLHELSKLRQYLDKRPTRKIRQEDVPKVMQVHSLNYDEGCVAVLRSNERKLQEVETLYSGQFRDLQPHYTTPRFDSLARFCDNLDALLAGLAGERSLLSDDVAVLRRCVGFWGRVKARRGVRSEA